MKVRFKKLNPNAVIPAKAHATDAGFDLVATSREVTNYGGFKYGFGIAVEIPSGYVGLIFPRSSVYKTSMRLTNCVGVIDSGYRGEISAVFDVFALETPPLYKVGDRIAQMIIMPYPEIEFEEAESLEDSDRGTGGYGSSGR